MFALYHVTPDKRCRIGFRFVLIMEAEKEEDLRRYMKTAGKPKKGKYLISDDGKCASVTP